MHTCAVNRKDYRVHVIARQVIGKFGDETKDKVGEAETAYALAHRAAACLYQVSMR